MACVLSDNKFLIAGGMGPKADLKDAVVVVVDEDDNLSIEVVPNCGVKF